jgi:hypothetical protein
MSKHNLQHSFDKHKGVDKKLHVHQQECQNTKKRNTNNNPNCKAAQMKRNHNSALSF